VSKRNALVFGLSTLMQKWPAGALLEPPSLIMTSHERCR
ncbi:uncharacterized protein METZ01_LOCUS335053, partial [marine metagenome]